MYPAYMAAGGKVHRNGRWQQRHAKDFHSCLMNWKDGCHYWGTEALASQFVALAWPLTSSTADCRSASRAAGPGVTAS